MTLALKCPHPDCGRTYRAPPEQVGRKSRCPACRRELTIGELELRTRGAQQETDAKPVQHDTHDSQSTAVRSLEATRPAVERIGRFEIREQLGAGAFGEVYRAFDRTLDREVALKVPRASTLGSARALDRFLREAKAAAQLRHPHIVPVFDAGQADGRHYIASAFIDGRPLSELIADGPVNFDRAATIVRALADALAYAHAQGIVHRDIKPDNVMIDQSGQPHIMDFGLARLSESTDKVTQDGTILGTAAYMAPEQARGELDQVGPISDQYSLGVVLYELLTGQTPFSGPPQIVLFHVLETEPPPIRGARADVPLDLETICQRAMAKEASGRYADCGALAEDLRRYLENEPIAARPIGRVERTVRWARRNPIVAGLTAAAALLLLAVATVSTTAYFHQARLSREKDDLITEKNNLATRETAEKEKAQSATKLAQSRLVRMQLDSGARYLDDGDINRALLLYQAAYQADPDPANAAIHRFRLANTIAEHKLQLEGILFHDRGITDGQFHPDGQRVMFEGTDDSVCIGDPQTSELTTPPMRHAAPLRNALFSPDGRFIATACDDGQVRLWNSDSGELVHAWPTGAKPLWCEFHPDRATLLASSTDGKIHQFSAADGGVVNCPIQPQSAVEYLKFDPGGTRLLTADDKNEARVWSWPDGAALGPPRPHKSSKSRMFPKFSADGRWLMTASPTPAGGVECQVWDREHRLAGSAPIVGEHFFLSPKGDLALLNNWKDSLIVRLPVCQVVSTLRHPRVSQWGCFSPDGSLVLTSSRGGRLHLWHTSTGATIDGMPRVTEYCGTIAFDATGSRMLTTTSGRNLRVWRIQPNAFPLKDAVADDSTPHDLRFSADGSRRILVEPDRKTISVVDTATQRPLLGPLVNPHPYKKRLLGNPKDLDCITRASLSPDGRLLVFVIASSGTLAAWDVDTGRCLYARPAALRGTIGNLRFSRDGTRIVTVAEDGLARLWDARRGNPLGPFVPTASQGQINPGDDGRRMVLVDPVTATVGVYDGFTGDRLLRTPIERALAAGNSKAWFSSDGRRMLLGRWNGSSSLAAPRQSMSVLREFAVNDMDLSAEQARYLVQLLTGEYLDETGGFQELPPDEFTHHSAAYRDAWLAYRRSSRPLPPPAPLGPWPGAAPVAADAALPPIPATSDPHRDLAAWAIAGGGNVRVRQGNRIVAFGPGRSFPEGNFQVIDLTVNNVADAHLSVIGGISTLETLSISGKGVTDEGLEQLRNLAGVQSLVLNGTSVKGPGLVHLAPLSKLTGLRLGTTAVTDSGLAAVRLHPGLETLHLERTTVSNAGLVHLEALTNLRSLGLSDTHVTDAGMVHLAKCKSLQSIELSGTQLTDTGLDSLLTLPSITTLGLSRTGVTDAGLQKLANNPALTSLHLGSLMISDAGLMHLARLPNLHLLTLYASPIGDAGLMHLRSSPRLETLYLHETNVTDAGLAHLATLPNLRTLMLHSTEVGDAGLMHLRSAPNLAALYLIQTKVTDAGLENLKAMPKLRLVNLTGTSVTKSGVETLRQALPNCTIAFSPP